MGGGDRRHDARGKVLKRQACEHAREGEARGFVRSILNMQRRARKRRREPPAYSTVNAGEPVSKSENVHCRAIVGAKKPWISWSIPGVRALGARENRRRFHNPPALYETYPLRAQCLETPDFRIQIVRLNVEVNAARMIDLLHEQHWFRVHTCPVSGFRADDRTRK
jgi:hypothetical protein